MRKLIVLLLMLVSTLSFSSFHAALDAEKSGDYQRALNLYLPLAEAGNVNAEINLGHIYMYHIVNYDKAYKWYSQAASQGSVNGYSSLGVMYQNGYGVDKNLAKAFSYFQLGARAGQIDSIVNLGYSYLLGLGADVDVTKGLYWMNIGARRGIPEALFNMGLLYTEGNNVPPNIKKGILYFKRALLGGSVAAAYKLGFLYELGNNQLKPSKIEAYKWFSIAAMEKYEKAVFPLRHLKQKMSQDQVDQAEKSLHAYLKKHPIKLDTTS